MTGFLLRRLGQSVLLLVLVSMIGFALLHLTPGGPMSQFANTPGMTEEDLRRHAAVQAVVCDEEAIVQPPGALA